MTHSIQLVIIGVIVSIAAYIILRLLRENERLMLELDEAKTEARTLDADLYEARRSNNKANAYIEQLNSQLNVMSERLAEYNNEAKGYKIRFEEVAQENEELREQIKSLQSKID